MSRQRAVRRKDDIAAIERVRRLVPFGNAQADISPGGLSRSGDVLQVFTDDNDWAVFGLPSLSFFIV